MARPYHSASSIALGARCQHAWALRYIGGLREPEITWPEIQAGAEHTSRQRSTALGRAVHAVYEAWHTPGETPNWHDLPGQIALSGAHLIPHPSEATAVFTERGIGREPLPPRDGDGPTTALRVHDLLWVGYRDLTVRPTAAAAARLGLHYAWMLVDYKSTASIKQYALTDVQLLADVQANLYAIDVCEELNLEAIQCRWLYLESKRVRRAQPVDVIISRAQALEIMVAPAALARELDAIETIDAAPKNPLACGDYGGCSYHHSAGGPCDARRSVGALIQARVSKKVSQPMALDPAIQARFNAIKNGGAAPAAAPPSTPPPAPAAPLPITAPQLALVPNAGATVTTAVSDGGMTLSTPVAAPAPAPARPRGRPRNAAAPAPVAEPAPAPVAANTPGVVGRVIALHAELVAAQAELDLAQAKLDGVIASLREALA